MERKRTNKQAWSIVAGLVAAVTLIFLAGAASAAPAAPNSNRVLQGVVTDESGVPLSGATVLVKGAAQATVTGSNGAFTLSVPEGGGTLQISLVGMKTTELEIGAQTQFNIALAPDVIGIDRVVVVGYGTMLKKDMTSAVSSLSGDDMNDRTSAFNLMQSIAGKMAGVEVVSLSGKPGGSTSLRIRGMASASSGVSKEPIYVVDGVIGVDPDIINTANIESIDVLKDAAATAIYGSQGGNGVVLITTRGGRKGSAQVSYDGRLGVGFLNRKIDLLDADQYMEVQRQAYAYSGQTMPHLTTPMENLFYYKKDASDNYERDANGNLIASPRYDTDWQDVLTQKAVTNDHIISFSQGNDRSSIYASLGWQDQQGLIRTTYSNRLTGTINASSRITDWARVQAIATIGQQKGNDNAAENSMNQRPIRNMMEMPPIIPVQYEDGTWGRKDDYPLGEEAENPLRMLQETKNLWNTDFGVFNLTATLDLTKKLAFTAQGGLNLRNRKTMEFSKSGMVDSHNGEAYASLGHNNQTRMTTEDYFTYNDKFFDDRLSSNFVLGASLYKYASEYFSTSSRDFDDYYEYFNLAQGLQKNTNNSSGEDAKQQSSFYFRMNHTFRDRYLFGFTFRADGASNFGPNTKWGYFPSASAAWRISEEEFFAPARKVVGNLKLRASYGTVGNATIPTYRTFARYDGTNVILNQSQQNYLVLSQLGNPDLKWEVSRQFNVGLDVSLLKNRLELIMDFYNKRTTDMLFSKQTPYFLGYPDTWTNIGELANRGFELTVTSRNIANRNFSWTTSLVFSTNRIIVADINGETIDTGNNTRAIEGQPWASYYIYKRLGTWSLAETEEAARYGKKPGDLKFEDVNHDYTIDDSDLQNMGSGIPKGNISLVNTFRYRGLSLMLDLNAAYGHKIMAITTTMGTNRPLYGNALSTALDAWTPEHQNTMIAANRLPNEKNWGENEKDSYMLYDGDFLRLRTIALTYDFNPKLLQKLKVVKGLQLGLYAENLHVFSSFPGFDPEMGLGNSYSSGQSIEFYSYPRPTVISGNIKITF
ncbi:MAG: TonB-dependent receptor [Rikenellaceae bacterium]|jgi:TonB-linked SusC/RagA family outer membrane protein|nr:TonB-dependent receptor [Rikenellaceae bacterium]